MGSTILKDVLPYAVMIGTRFTKINRTGMRRGAMSEAEMDAVQQCYDRFGEIDRAAGPYAKEVRAFMRGSKRGIYGPQWAAAGRAG